MRELLIAKVNLRLIEIQLPQLDSLHPVAAAFKLLAAEVAREIRQNVSEYSSKFRSQIINN